MALYSKTHNSIFIHIYKCGGMSIRKMFADTEIEEIGTSHCTVSECEAEFIRLNRGGEFYKAYKFCFVRNPYTWILSLFNHIIFDISHEHHSEIINMDVNKFVGWLIDAIKEKRKTVNGTYLKQSDFILYNNISWFKYEHFITGVRELILIGALPNKKIPHENKGLCVSVNYSEQYSKKTIEIINEYFISDFKLLGYL